MNISPIGVSDLASSEHVDELVLGESPAYNQATTKVALEPEVNQV